MSATTVSQNGRKNITGLDDNDGLSSNLSADNTPIPTEEIGSIGLNTYWGQTGDAVAMETSGPQWRKTLKRMERRDPIVGAILQAVELLIRQVEWRTEPSDPLDPEAVEIATYIDECFNDMSQPWGDTLSEILSFLTYGWSWLEIVYKGRGGPDTPDGRWRSKHDDGRIGWRKWAIRPQDTLDRWEFDENGGIKGMWQMAWPSYKPVFLSIEKCLHFRTISRANNPEGRSIFENAYEPWYYKTNIQRIEAIGIEREMAGMPLAYVPERVMAKNPTANDREIRSHVERVVFNLKQDKQMGLVMPQKYDEHGNPLYELKLLSSSGQRAINTDTTIQRYDERIAISALADFLLLGHNGVGSFKLSSDKVNLFSVALNARLGTVCEVSNSVAIPRLMRLGGLPLNKAPKRTHTPIESIDLATLIDFVFKLARAGVSIADKPEIVTYLLKQATLPVSTTPTTVVAPANTIGRPSLPTQVQQPVNPTPVPPDFPTAEEEEAAEDILRLIGGRA